MAKQEYCADAGELIDKDEHEDCVCKECIFCCGRLTDKNRWSLEMYINVYAHRKCILPYLEGSGEIRLDNGD